MVSDTTKHYPVLLNEIISIISPQHGGTFIDCTFGQGGYTKKILNSNNTKVIALDRDLESKKIADRIQEKFKERFIFKNLRFSQLNNLKLKREDIRGVVFDLGYSLIQMKDEKKGLSFNSLGSLNMKLGLNKFSAEDVVNKLDKDDLERIFKYFGEEIESRKIAKKIIEERKIRKIDTQSLVKIIDKTKTRKNYKVHNATKVFQSLRIFVNNEISELIFGLINATKVLKKGGVLAVVTFHSLEDKIVKYFFKELSEEKSISRYQPKTEQRPILFFLKKKKPITPTARELRENISSRSAKLRYVIKKENFYDFETDLLKKFQFLLDIEDLGKKL